MMKKLIILLICIMLVQLMPSSVMAAEEEPVFSESFENYVTGAFPSAFTSGGAMNAYVAEIGTGDKALCIVKRSGYAGKIAAEFPQIKGNYVLSFKIKTEGGAFSGGVRLTGADTETPVSVENNTVYTGAGKRYGLLHKGKWTRFDIVFYESEARNGRYDLYIDGALALSQWKFETSGFSAPDMIQFYTRTTADDINFYIDDVRIYSGTEIRDDASFAKKEYNSRNVEFEEKDFSVGTTILLQEDFEKSSLASVALSFTGTGNKELYYDEERKSQCLYVNDASYGKYNLFVNQKGLKTFPRVVYQADICLKAYTGSTQLFMFKYDGDSKFVYTANINEKGGGVLSLYDGTQIASLKKDKWYTVAAAYDYMNQTFDFYLDGKLMEKNVPFYDRNFDSATSSRLLYWNLSAKTQILCDNVFVYEGTEQREIINGEAEEAATEISDAWTADSVAENLLIGTLAFHCTSGAVWSNNQKSYPEIAGFIENDVFYLPLRTIADAAGKEIIWDGEAGAVNIDGISIKDGMTQVNINGKDITLSGAVTIRNGVTYIPSDLIGRDRLFGMNCITTIGGTCILDALSYTEQELVEINRYMVSERPDSKQIEADYLNHGYANVHPRLFADSARFEELKKTLDTDPYIKKWYEKYKSKAEQYLEKEIVKYDAGNRLNNANEVTNRVQTLSLMYRMTGESKYLDKAYAEMKSILEWPQWEDGLVNGTIAYMAALGYDWLYDGMTAEQRTYIEETMCSRVLNAYNDSYSNPEWAKLESNWNFVGNSGMLAALVLTDVYPQTCYGIISNAARSLEYGLETFCPDGQWFEGPGYWSYAVEHMVPIFMGLNSVLGTDYRLSKFRGVDKTADYIIQMQGPAGTYNYSDTITAAFTNMPGIFYLAQLYNRPEWITQRLKMIDEQGFDIFLIDFITYTPQKVETVMPNNALFRSEFGNLAVLRGDSLDSNSIYLAYRAGKARVSHGQQDAGSFILDMNGLRWAEDLGREAYSVPGYNTSGDSRWTFYKTRAEGHNTIVIDPDEGHARNLDGLGYVEKSEFAAAGGYSIMNLDEVYSNKAAGYRRGFKLDDNRRSVVIRDEIDLNGEQEIYWFMHTKAEINAEGNRVMLTQGEEKLCMDCIVEGGEAQIYAAPAEPFATSPNPAGQSKHENISKVTIKVKGKGRVNITVKMYDPRDAEYISAADNTPLDSWSAPTYEMEERPKLDGIYFDGVMADGFSPDGGKVVYTYDYDQERPEVTVSCREGISADMKEIKGADGTDYIEITAYRDSNTASFRRYRVELKFIPYLRNNLDGFTKYETITVRPCGNYDQSFPPKNLSDNDLETRFAVQGINQDVADIDLGEEVVIDAIALAFYDALARVNQFDISVSTDGKNFTKVLSDKSTALTKDYEIRKIEPVKARYVRYTGYGNSVNDWNNITEFAALKQH